MWRNNKVLILLIALAGVIIALILGGTYFFLKKETSQSNTAGNSIDFSPFGQSGDNPNGSASQGTNTPSLPSQVPAATVPLLRQLSNTPVATFMTGITKNGTDNSAVSYARFMERATGHVFEVPLSLVTPAVKISNTTIPRIQEALWAPDGRYIAIRYYDEKMEHVATYLAQLMFASTTVANELHLEEAVSASTTLQGIFLDNDIPNLVFSPDGSSLFYLVRTAGGARGYVRSLDKKTNKLVFSSPLNELLPTWDNANTVILTTKPAATIPGYAFSLNLKTGAVDNTLTEVPGLTARTDIQDNHIIFFSVEENAPLLQLLDIKTGTISGLRLPTLPEKCAWSKLEQNILYCAAPAQTGAGYPDVWYRGEATYQDILWKINIETGSQDIVVIPNEAVGRAMDATNLALSPDENFLLFIDKRDGTLWSAKLREPASAAQQQSATATTTP